MNGSVVVADAGPLLALAKLDALELLIKLYRVVYTSSIVCDETVTQGLAQNAPDAVSLKAHFDQATLIVRTVQSPTKLKEPVKIHDGERESIQLAIELGASEFLVDDSRARRVAELNFSTANLTTITRGTLGIIYRGFRKNFLSREQAIQLLESIKIRRDIWINSELCDRILDLIRR